jgi:uncharacterized protein involved in exopolysaccharide biosynthesis
MEPTEYSEQIDFQKYWLVLRRRWLPATGVLGIIVGLATLAAFLQEPIYEAEGKLLFKPDSSSSLTGLKNDIGDVVRIGEKSDPLSTEVEIILSTPILQQVLHELGLRDEKGKPLDPKSIVKSKQLKVSPVTGTDILAVTYKDNEPKIATAVVNKLMEVYLENNILSNRAKATKAREFITQQLPSIEDTVRQADAALRKFKEENRVVALPEEATAAVKAISDFISYGQPNFSTPGSTCQRNCPV